MSRFNWRDGEPLTTATEVTRALRPRGDAFIELRWPDGSSLRVRVAKSELHTGLLVAMRNAERIGVRHGLGAVVEPHPDGIAHDVVILADLRA